jgi:hypothetical protein
MCVVNIGCIRILSANAHVPLSYTKTILMFLLHSSNKHLISGVFGVCRREPKIFWVFLLTSAAFSATDAAAQKFLSFFSVLGKPSCSFHLAVCLFVS